MVGNCEAMKWNQMKKRKLSNICTIVVQKIRKGQWQANQF